MIYTVYLNPTIDKTIYLERLERGGTNRPQKVLTQAGGKGMNVSVVLANLGRDNTMAGVLYAGNAHYIRSRADSHGIGSIFLEYPGEARVNTKIFDGQAREVTEINESGPAVSAAVLDEFEARFLPQVAENDAVVLTGSLPPGCPKDYYRRLLEKLPCPCVLDADGEALKHGVTGRPLFIKPNIAELSQLTGETLATNEQILAACARLIAGGVGFIAVSMGAQGALITDAKQAYFAPALKLEVDSTVGAGDSMVAGMLHAWLNGSDLGEILRSGAAASAASITLPGTNLATQELYQSMLEQVEARAL